jgi:hypothetical protein
MLLRYRDGNYYNCRSLEEGRSGGTEGGLEARLRGFGSASSVRLSSSCDMGVVLMDRLC